MNNIHPSVVSPTNCSNCYYVGAKRLESLWKSCHIATVTPDSGVATIAALLLWLWTHVTRACAFSQLNMILMTSMRLNPGGPKDVTWFFLSGCHLTAQQATLQQTHFRRKQTRPRCRQPAIAQTRQCFLFLSSLPVLFCTLLCLKSAKRCLNIYTEFSITRCVLNLDQKVQSSMCAVQTFISR